VTKSRVIAHCGHKVTNVTSPGLARRTASPSALRRASEIVLVAGTVLAALAALGPSWAARTGVAVAVVAAVLACIFAWRELFWERRQHHRAMLAAAWAHGEALTEERTRNAAVVETLNTRLRDAGSLIERQRVTIAEIRIKLSSLRGDKVYLEGEVAHREKVISALRETVRAREAELIALRDEEDAEVHHMPKRVLAEHESTAVELLPAPGDLWTDTSAPTVVDLKMLETAMVLPNYEADRQVG
jgi:hypothetical protein